MNIRRYQGVPGQQNAFFHTRWLGRLARIKNRRKNFEQLLRNKSFLAAFDALLDIPALFGGFRLSMVHQLISMRCHEVSPRDRLTARALTSVAKPILFGPYSQILARCLRWRP